MAYVTNPLDANRLRRCQRTSSGGCTVAPVWYDCSPSSSLPPPPLSPPPTLPSTPAPSVIGISWVAGFGGPSARQRTGLKAGDVLVFTWHNTHNVYIMPDKAAFDECDFGRAQLLGDQSGVSYTWTGAATPVYFACRVNSHCDLGQKLTASSA